MKIDLTLTTEEKILGCFVFSHLLRKFAYKSLS